MKKTAQNIVLLISALLIAIASTGFWQKSSCCTVSEEMSCCSPEDACEMPDESSSEGETEEDCCCSLQAAFDFADIKYKIEQSEKTNTKVFLDDVFLFPIKILLSVQLFLTFPEEYSSHSPHAPPHLAFSGREILLKKSVLRI
jgi:hypothetical protein